MEAQCRSICFEELDSYNADKTGNSNVDLSSMMRDKLKEVEVIARSMSFEYLSQNKNEAYEQSVLALRHIEDARMRYGKVIQYSQDGISKYDK